MDDEEYAGELFEILTAPPDPDLEPGQLGDDWIDREDGFGTEVRVTAVDVLPGPYGAQVEVGFLLDLPPGVDVPQQASVLLPLDEEWRTLCGFADPEDYAPRLASRVMWAAREHVNTHTNGPRSGFDVPSRDEQHVMLMHVLGRLGAVEHVALGRYVIRVADGDEIVVILTPDEWEQVLRRNGSPRDGVFDHYEELFASNDREQRFWVFWEGDLTSSTREALPPATTPWPTLREVRRRIAEARTSGKDFGWFAYEPTADDELPG